MEAKVSKVMKLANVVVPVLLIAAFLLLMLFLGRRGEATPIINLALKPFVMPTGDLEGPKTEADLKGKVTFISFWATWCGPCRGELPQVGRIYDQFRMDPDVQIWTISLDQPANANIQDRIRDLFDKKGVSLPVYVLDEALEPESLMPQGIPHALLVDPEGRVVQQWTGAHAGFEKEVAKAVTELLKKQGEKTEKPQASYRGKGGLQSGCAMAYTESRPIDPSVATKNRLARARVMESGVW